MVSLPGTASEEECGREGDVTVAAREGGGRATTAGRLTSTGKEGFTPTDPGTLPMLFSDEITADARDQYLSVPLLKVGAVLQEPLRSRTRARLQPQRPGGA